MKKHIGTLIYISLGLIYAYILGLVIFLLGSLSDVPEIIQFLLWVAFMIAQAITLIKNFGENIRKKLLMQLLYFFLTIVIFYCMDPAP